MAPDCGFQRLMLPVETEASDKPWLAMDPLHVIVVGNLPSCDR
jgi:hypothetical protein